MKIWNSLKYDFLVLQLKFFQQENAWSLGGLDLDNSLISMTGCPKGTSDKHVVGYGIELVT